ncbi:hypothetical protein N9N03_00790 [Chlamydiia bacterium]|nr:hypothetical protein [Chlamydiia bacterium]
MNKHNIFLSLVLMFASVLTCVSAYGTAPSGLTEDILKEDNQEISKIERTAVVQIKSLSIELKKNFESNIQDMINEAKKTQMILC